MARTTQAQLIAKLATASRMGNYPEGHYPTPGQLVLDHNGYGYAVCLVVNDAGAQADLSPTGLTAKECSLWLDGFIAGFDAPARRAHWGI